MNPTSTNAGHRTVVVGIDGRPATLRAAVWAAREATRRDATRRSRWSPSPGERA
jgi:hypothetical protein